MEKITLEEFPGGVTIGASGENGQRFRRCHRYIDRVSHLVVAGMCGAQNWEEIANIVKAWLAFRRASHATFLEAQATFYRVIPLRVWKAFRSEERKAKRLQHRNDKGRIPNGSEGMWQDVLDPEQLYIKGENVAIVRAALACLGERDQTILRRREFDGWSFAEIGTELGISEDAARAGRYNAIKRLRIAFFELTAEEAARRRSRVYV